MHWLTHFVRPATAARATTTPIVEPRVSGAVIMASLVINLLALGMPLVVLQVYDRVLPNRATETLLALMIGLAGVVALDFLLKAARASALGWTATAFTRQWTQIALTRLMKAPHGDVERVPVSTHVAHLNAVSGIGDYHGSPSRLMAIDLPFATIFLAVVALVGGSVVLIPIGLFAVFFVLSLRRSLRLRSVINERSQCEKRKYDFVHEVLSGIHTVKSMAMEQAMLRRFERLQQSVAEVTYRSLRVAGSAQSSTALYSNLSQVAVVAYGGFLVIDGRLSMGALACCTLLAGQILQPLLRAIALWAENETITFKREEASRLFALKGEVHATIKTLDTSASIEFDRVSFAYGKDAHMILKDVSFAVRPGEVVGIRGADGSGRSTLLRLIRGDAAATEGRISVAGLDPQTTASSLLRSAVIYVGAAPTVFRGTILENLTVFDPNRRDAALQAAALVGLDEGVHQLAEGFDTRVGESIADDLPTGFAQKIVLARALTRAPRILILDEANAVLDHASEVHLARMIQAMRGRLTIVLVTHRPSLMALADRTLLLAGGTVREVNPSEKATQGPVASALMAKVAS